MSYPRYDATAEQDALQKIVQRTSEFVLFNLYLKLYQSIVANLFYILGILLIYQIHMPLSVYNNKTQ